MKTGKPTRLGSDEQWGSECGNGCQLCRKVAAILLLSLRSSCRSPSNNACNSVGGDAGPTPAPPAAAEDEPGWALDEAGPTTDAAPVDAFPPPPPTCWEFNVPGWLFFANNTVQDWVEEEERSGRGRNVGWRREGGREGGT